MRPGIWPAATSRGLREQIAAARTLAIVGSLLGAGAIAAGTVAGSSGGAQAGGALITATPGLVQRNLLSYRRSEEMNADQAAARYLNATGQSIRGMLTTFERFSQSLSLSGVQVDQYQISHPPLPRERIALLEELARKSQHFDAKDPPALVNRASTDARQDRRLYRRRERRGAAVLPGQDLAGRTLRGCHRHRSRRQLHRIAAKARRLDPGAA